MRTTVERRHITDQMLTWLADTGKPVGDGEAPAGGGWQGEVNKSNFTPYVVLSVLSGSPDNAGPLGDAGSSVTFSYALTVYGLSREQCEWMADEARRALEDRPKTVVAMSSHNQRINYITTQTYGGINRLQQEPPYYACTDVVNVFTTKE